MPSKPLDYYYDAPVMEVIGEGTTILAVSPEAATATRYSLTLSNGTVLEFTSMRGTGEGHIAISILPNAKSPPTGAPEKEVAK